MPPQLHQRCSQARPRRRAAFCNIAVLLTIALMTIFVKWGATPFAYQPSLSRKLAVSTVQSFGHSPRVLRSSLPQGKLSLKAEEGSIVGTTSSDGPGILTYAGGAVAAVAGLVALLYVTKAFDMLLHSSASTGLLQGKSMLAAALTGLLVGALHTLAGPDHFAGLAPLVIGQRRTPFAAFGLGALWGSGHATGQLILGLAALAVQMGFVRLASTPALEGLSSYLVGASLIAIGMLGLHEASQFDESELGTAEDGERKSRFGWTTYATGVLHGLSPDALVFLAPAFALPGLAAVLFVSGVTAGTLLSMAFCTAMLSALCQRLPRFKLVSAAASSVAMLLGVCILAEAFGFVIPLPGL